jgi:hypothetical protein
MSDRIDAYLAGILARDALTTEERLEGDAAAAVVRDTREFIAASDTPDVTDAVMRRVTSAPHTRRRPGLRVLDAIVESLWVPRQIAVRPVYALVAASACLALAMLIAPYVRDLRADTAQSRTQPMEPRLFVQFRLQTEASQVRLAGSFTNWQPVYELHQTSPGVWTVTVPLSQGVHDYAFVVDGERWMSDPYAPGIHDGFGGTNSRLTLLVPDAPRT